MNTPPQDLSFGGLIYASNFIQNKGHIFIVPVICIKFYMNFDGMF